MTFTDYQTIIPADWLNNVNTFVNTPIVIQELYVNPKDAQFGAKGDGVTDDTAALQACFNYATARYLSVFIPSGVYVVTAPLTFQIQTNPVIHPGQNEAYSSIYGSGSSSTVLWYTAGNGPNGVLNILGTGNFSDKTTIQGFRIAQNFTLQTGIGLNLSQLSGVNMTDVAVIGFNTGMYFQDVLSSSFRNLWLAGNIIGVNAVNNTTSPLNATRWDTCLFSNNSQVALVAPNSVNVEMDNCIFEGNGNGAASTIELSFNGANGAALGSIRNCYFELTTNMAEIYVTLVPGCGSGTFSVENNTFDRQDSTNFVRNCVLIDATALSPGNPKFVINCRGNAFRAYGTYPPDSSRPTIALATGSGGYDGFCINDVWNDNTFSTVTIDGPAIPTATLIDGQAMAYINASGTIFQSFGFTASTLSSTGVFVLTFPRKSQIISANVTPLQTGFACITNYGTNTITVQTYSPGGTLTSLPFSITVRSFE